MKAVKEFLLDKQFKLSAWAIDNPITVYVIMGIILAGGLAAFITLPRESFPEIVENKVYISSAYPGTPAEDVSKLITEPIEDEVRDISGIINVESTSFSDYAITIVEFDDGYSNEEAKIKIKDKIDNVKAQSDWPTLDTGPKVEPNVFDLNISEETPILNINLRGNYTSQALKEYGEKLQDIIEELPAIKEVSIRGVDDKEVEVALDIYKMTSAQVSFQDVISAISNENVTISGGNVINQGKVANIRVVGEIKDPSELEGITIKYQGGSVYLSSIADIKFKEKERTTFAREALQPVVMLDVKKRSGENMIDASAEIEDLVEEAKASLLPKDLEVTITNDQAPRTQNQVDDLINNIIFGVILVVGVLMFFLGLRNASFVGFAIPLSMLMSLIIVQFIGDTMNTMVLFALVMGLGMLVDNGIVVVENVYTLVNEGWSKKAAAKQGVAEIAWPIIASTATTLAAFFPLGLWPGTMGKFMIYFPKTLSIVLFSSLFVALIINAMLTSKFMLVNTTKTKKTGNRKLLVRSLVCLILGGLLVGIGYSSESAGMRILGNLFLFSAVLMWLYKFLLYPSSLWFQNKLLPALENRYRNVLRWVLKGYRPVFTVVAMIFLFFFSIFLVGASQPKVLFFPEQQPNQIFVYMEYPEGTDIEKTNATAKIVEKRVTEVLQDYVIKKDGSPYNYMAEVAIGQVGQGATNPQTDAGSNAEVPQKAKITVSLREFKLRKDENGKIQSSKEMLIAVREALQGIPGFSLSVESEPVGPPAGYPLNIEFQGEDYHSIMDEAERMIAFIKDSGIGGIEQLKTDVSRDNTEIQLDVNEQVAGGMGITNSMIGRTLRQAIYGWEASRYRPVGDDDDYPVNIRLKKDQRYDESLLFTQPITYRNPANGQLMQVPISTLANPIKTKQFSQIKRKDFRKTITVYSNILKEEGYNPTEVVNKVKEKLESSGYHLPKGMSYKFTGEQEEQAKQMSFLLKALMFAVVGIILIIVLQFNSVSKPLIIMTAVLLSFIGVFLGLVISGSEFVILMTMMGIISLAGIVVNNAIVLIDYTQLLTDRKKRDLVLDETIMLPIADMKETIIEGGRSRLRPVLLTAITTILGLIPLAIGLNIDFFSLLQNYNPKIYLGGDNVAFWGPLAWTVIYGLTFATFLTLVIVPVLQYLVNRLKFRFRYGSKGVNYPEVEKIGE